LCILTVGAVVPAAESIDVMEAGAHGDVKALKAGFSIQGCGERKRLKIGNNMTEKGLSVGLYIPGRRLAGMRET
jgi:hypothetical protein